MENFFIDVDELEEVNNDLEYEYLAKIENEEDNKERIDILQMSHLNKSHKNAENTR